MENRSRFELREGRGQVKSLLIWKGLHLLRLLQIIGHPKPLKPFGIKAFNFYRFFATPYNKDAHHFSNTSSNMRQWSENENWIKFLNKLSELHFFEIFLDIFGVFAVHVVSFYYYLNQMINFVTLSCLIRKQFYTTILNSC